MSQDLIASLLEALSAREGIPPAKEIVNEDMPKGAVAVGRVPPPLQHLFTLVEDARREASEAAILAAAAKQAAQEKNKKAEALKTIFFQGLENHFVDKVPKDAGGIGIADDWLYYYLDRAAAQALMSNRKIREMFGGVYIDDQD